MTKIGPPVLKLDISNEQSTILIWADTVVCNLILSTVCYAFHCAIDRPNGRIAAICTDKVPGQRVDRLSLCNTVIDDSDPVDYL